MTKKNDIKFLRVTYLARTEHLDLPSRASRPGSTSANWKTIPSNLLPGFTTRLTTWLPGLIEHHCGVGYHGGFLERLNEGTWAGHILEHVVLEAAEPGRHEDRLRQDPLHRRASASTRWPSARADNVVGRAALEVGHRLLMAAINDDAVRPARRRLPRLTDLVDRLCLGPSTAHIVDAATDRRIPSIRLTDGNLVQLGYGAAQRRIWTAETDRTSAIAEGIASDKDLTKTLLASCGVPVPEGAMVAQRRRRPGKKRRTSACRWSSSRSTATTAAASR